MITLIFLSAVHLAAKPAKKNKYLAVFLFQLVYLDKGKITVLQKIIVVRNHALCMSNIPFELKQ